MATPVAFITGASRGIGKQLALDFARNGYDLVVIARSTKESPTKLPGTVDETAALVRRQGQRCLPLGVDLRVEAQINAAVERAYAEFGRLDLLINNAAVAPPGKALEAPVRRWRLAVEINLTAPFLLMHAVCPRMAGSGGGAVINISSGAAQWPDFGRPSYTTTKRGLEALTEALAHELQEDQVAVNALQLELSVWSEGYAFTLPDVDTHDFEDPIIMSDACLWLAQQPRSYTGHILTIGELRRMGVVRPRTRIGDRQ